MATADIIAARMAAPGITSVVLPATIQDIDTALFAALPNAAAIQVAHDNPAYTTYNGMLFNKELTDLLLVPEGMEGAAVLPGSTVSVPACVFSRCTKLSTVSIPTGSTGSQSFTSWNGILYTNDLTTLVAAPAGLGASATIAPECQTIAEAAFWGNRALKTIVANGAVADIQPAFAESVIKAATVVTADPQAWEAAGFKHFADPVQPGEAAQADGFAYTLLDDYTASVAWAGEGEAPAELTIPATAVIGSAEYAVSTIAEDAFAGQPIIALTVPEGVSSVSARAFAECAALESAQLAGSVTSIGASAFEGCTQLASVELGGGLRTIGASAFEGAGIAEAVLPAGVETIADRAFAGCPNLTAIVALASVPEVADAALADTTGVSIYTPHEASGEYAWSIGPVASANHLLPYGAQAAAPSLTLSVGEAANAFAEGGYLEAPGDAEVTIAYKANAVSADLDGTITAKQPGNTAVTYTVSYHDLPLAKAATTVIVPNPPADKDEASEEISNDADASDADIDEVPSESDATSADLGFYYDDDLTDEELADLSSYFNASENADTNEGIAEEEVLAEDVENEAFEFEEYQYDDPEERDDDLEADEEPITEIFNKSRLASSTLNRIAELGENFGISTYSGTTSDTPRTDKKSYYISIDSKDWFAVSGSSNEELVIRGAWCNVGETTGDGHWSIANGNGNEGGDTSSIGRASYNRSHETNEGLLEMRMLGDVTGNAQNVRFGFSNGRGLVHTYTTWYAAKNWFNMDDLGTGDAKGKYNTEAKLRNNTDIIPFARRTNDDLATDNKIIYPFSITIERTGYSATRWISVYDGGEIANSKQSVGVARSLVDYNEDNIYLQFEPNIYTLHFHKEGGSGGIDSKSVKFDSNLSNLASSDLPSRSGYKFNGYYTEPDGKGTMYFDKDGVPNPEVKQYTVASDLQLYAAWDGNPYQITLQNGSEAYPQTSKVEAKMGAALPALTSKPTRTAYDFKGYYTQENGGGTCYYDETLAAYLDPNVYNTVGDLTLYAYWVKHQYQITFNMNGGYYPHANAAPKNVYYGDALPALSSSAGYLPIRDGYEFLGWYDGSYSWNTQYYNNRLEGQVKTYNRTSDLALTALWGYKLKFIDPLGSRSNGSNVKEYLVDTFGTVVNSSYGKWETPNNLSGWTYAGIIEAPVNSSTGNVNRLAGEGSSPNYLYERATYVSGDPYWTLWYRDVTLNSNGGEKSSQTTVRVYLTGGDISNSNTVSENRLSFRNFTLYGKRNDGSGALYAHTNTTGGLKSDRALWKPSRTGYIFKGFTHSTASNAKEYVDRFGDDTFSLPAPSVTAWNFIGSTVYAKWSEFKYTIEYDGGGASGTMTSQKVGFGEEVTINSSGFTSPAGKHFVNWKGDDGNTYEALAHYAHGLIDSEDDCETGSDDCWSNGDKIILTAQWTWNTYTITYKPGDESSGEEVTQDATVNSYPTIKDNFYDAPLGKHFKNWQRTTGVEISPGKQSGDLATSQGANVTLTPKWDWNTYTIAYDANSGSGKMNPTTATVNTNPYISACGFTAPRGKRFNGWNTAKDGSGTSVPAGAYYSGDLTKEATTVTLYAQWVNDVYTITLNNDKATENGTSTIYLKYSEGYFSDISCVASTAISSINIPKRLGYTFANYPDLIDGSGRIVGSTTLFAANTTLTPQWIANTYTIQLMANNGTMDHRDVQFNFDEVAAGTKRLGANTFTKDWHDFAKWNTVPDGSGVSYGDNALITQELAEAVARTGNGFYSLYAQWTQVYFNVTWETNGGDFVESQMVHQGEKIPQATTERTGYTFDGWYKDEALSQRWDFDRDLMPWGEVTLYAKWNANKFNVTFDPNGGAGDEFVQKYTYNLYNDSGKTQAQRLPSADDLGFAKRGNNFACWTTAPEWDGNLDSPNVYSKSEEISVNLSTGDDVVLYAQWTPITYYVFFNSNRQDNSSTITGDNMGLQELTYDKNTALKANTISHESYAFEGWNTVPNPTDEDPGIWIKDGAVIGDLSSGADIENLRDYFDVVVLYAQWKGHAYTVSFDNNPPHAGSVSGSIPDMTFYWGLTETLPIAGETLKCTNGWIFNGWNSKADGTGTAYADGAQIKNLEPEEGESRVVLYAQWRITFNVDIPTVNYINVTMNPEGEWITVDSQDVTVRSYSPVKVGIQGVGCDSNLEGLGQILEDVSQASQLELKISSQGTTVPLSPGTTAFDSNFYFKMEEGSSGNPSTLPVNVDLATAKGANVRLREHVDAVSGFDLWFVLGLAEELT